MNIYLFFLPLSDFFFHTYSKLHFIAGWWRRLFQHVWLVCGKVLYGVLSAWTEMRGPVTTPALPLCTPIEPGVSAPTPPHSYVSRHCLLPRSCVFSYVQPLPSFFLPHSICMSPLPCFLHLLFLYDLFLLFLPTCLCSFLPLCPFCLTSCQLPSHPGFSCVFLP